MKTYLMWCDLALAKSYCEIPKYIFIVNQEVDQKHQPGSQIKMFKDRPGWLESGIYNILIPAWIRDRSRVEAHRVPFLWTHAYKSNITINTTFSLNFAVIAAALSRFGLPHYVIDILSTLNITWNKNLI